jgi:hypothetical protein
MGCARRSYQPRHAEASVLHGVIRDHLDDFLRAAADRANGAGRPEFNVTRGHIVFGEDLVAALDEGLIGGAGLGVTDPEPLPAGHRPWTHP